MANTLLDGMEFFDLGCQVTRHLHGITQKAELTAMLKVVKDIADGTLTLIDTPEEFVSQLDSEQKAFADRVPDLLRMMRLQERAAAQRIWAGIIALSEGGQ